MANLKTLIFEYDGKELHISDLDSDKEIRFGILDKSDENIQFIFLEYDNLFEIRDHLDYLINKN